MALIEHRESGMNDPQRSSERTKMQRKNPAPGGRTRAGLGGGQKAELGEKSLASSCGMNNSKLAMIASELQGFLTVSD
jgi:hypothetical protein